MSSIKVSALTAKTSPSGSEELLINDGGTSKKITIANLPDTDTTYSNFSGTTAGLVPTSTTGDDTKFLRADGTWVVPTDTDTDTDTTYSAGTTTTLGLIKLEDATAQTTAANTVTATASRTYGVQVNASGQGVVNVPWVNTDTDTDTTYTSSDFSHDSLSGVTANEHIDWTTDQGATNLHSGNYTDTDTVYTHPTTAGNKHIPTAGATDQYLKYDSSGTAVWADVSGGATGGGTDKVFVENDAIVTTNYTVARNASSVGPITINTAATVTVNTGINWVVL